MERFWNKVDKLGDCWEWTASTDDYGYGQFGIDGKILRAHRVAYKLVYGDIPEGLCVCHHCDNPGCIRPSHLFLGTYRDNTQDAVAKGRMKQPDNRGEKHGMSKLVEDDIHDIRQLNSSGVERKLLAKMWEVSEVHISNIVNRKKWKHI